MLGLVGGVWSNVTGVFAKTMQYLFTLIVCHVAPLVGRSFCEMDIRLDDTSTGHRILSKMNIAYSRCTICSI